MQRVIDVQTMRHSEAIAIANGTPSRELMRRAGEGIFQSYPWKGPCAIVCGSGNNAGDGYVLAALLHDANIPCTVFLLSDRFSEDGSYYYEKCKEKGVQIQAFTSDTDFSVYTEIVDCIFGTGFYGAVQGLAATAIHKINRSGKTVISVDINSGLDSNSGLSALCVKSTLTVSIGFYKNGHFLNSAKDVIGNLHCVDIGIPLQGEFRKLPEASDLRSVLTHRLQNSHKGNYGYVSILGGCTEYAGAVKLANISCAALRSGCGVAKLIIPSSLFHAVSPFLLESTLALLPEKDGHALFDAVMLDRLLAGQKALAVGMGWGQSPENARFLEHILKNHALSLVIDADGLNTLATMDKSILCETKCKVLLTPHLKEMERLSGLPLAEIQQSPVESAENFAKKYKVCVLLKGACTVVTNGEETYLVPRGCSGMATAGSGDVLSGILTGIFGYSDLTPLSAACGAYIAGRAGELAQQENNAISMIASDTVRCIGKAISEIIQ